MKKLALGALIAAMAACGGGGGGAGNDGGGGGGGDGGVDAPPACNVFGAAGNQGCDTGQKCTWIVDNATAETGHLGCATAGTAADGSGCTFSGSGTGFDNCVAGDFCIGGACEEICDPNGTAKTCDSQHSCGTYEGLFGPPAGPDTAGVCDPTCDPLTQVVFAGSANACGSTIPCSGSGSGCGSDGPELGCYPFLGDGVATCSNTPEGRGMPAATDFVPCDAAHDCSNSNGDAYPNGCAPGFIGFYFESTANMQVMCTGLCAPLETDVTKPQNGPGDATTLGKLPQDPAPIAGRNACKVLGRAGKAAEECSYIWPVLLDSNITDSPYNDTLGVCFRPGDFQYDPTNSGSAANETKNEPPCSTLKAGSAAEAEANGLTNVACEGVDGSGNSVGSNADCYAVEHGCYNLEDSGIDLGSGSGSATAHLLNTLHNQPVPRFNRMKDFRLPLTGMKYRRAGGLI
jgi:hypothetical protein